MDSQPPISPFIAFLENLKEKNDTGALASLRRGFSEATEHHSWPLIARFCNLEDSRKRTVFQFIAASYATHKKNYSEGNFGTTLRLIATENSTSKNEALKSFEKKFQRLLTCESPQKVCEFLPGIIRAAKSKDIPINYEQLLKDLQYWNKRIKLRWAQAYWGTPKEEGDNL